MPFSLSAVFFNLSVMLRFGVLTQLVITCLKSTIEPLEKGVKYVQTLSIFCTFSNVSIVEFEQLISVMTSLTENIA